MHAFWPTALTSLFLLFCSDSAAPAPPIMPTSFVSTNLSLRVTGDTLLPDIYGGMWFDWSGESKWFFANGTGLPMWHLTDVFFSCSDSADEQYNTLFFETCSTPGKCHCVSYDAGTCPQDSPAQVPSNATYEGTRTLYIEGQGMKCSVYSSTVRNATQVQYYVQHDHPFRLVQLVATTPRHITFNWTFYSMALIKPDKSSFGPGRSCKRVKRSTLGAP